MVSWDSRNISKPGAGNGLLIWIYRIQDPGTLQAENRGIWLLVSISELVAASNDGVRQSGAADILKMNQRFFGRCMQIWR